MSDTPPTPPACDGDADTLVETIGRTMTRMRLMIGRRFIGRLAIQKMGAGLELSHLDVIGIVRRVGEAKEVTVGAIAEQMHIDPSRASRVVADLVRRGVLERAASQEDARRTVVQLTAKGFGLLSKVEEAKTETIGGIVADWSPEDIACFARLYDRFMIGFEERMQQFDAQTGAGEGSPPGLADGHPVGHSPEQGQPGLRLPATDRAE